MAERRIMMNRRAAMYAFLGGITYLLVNLLIETFFPDHWVGSPARLLGMSYAGWARLLWIPGLLLLFGLIGLYRHLAHALGKLGKTGYWLAITGFVLSIAGNLIEFWVYGVFLVPWVGEFTTGSAGSQLGYTVESYGSLLAILGLLLFGIACFRSELPTHWRMLPPLLGLISISIFYFYFTNLLAVHVVLYGLCWAAAGYFLWRDGSLLIGEIQ